MKYLYLAPMLIILYMIAMDKNLGEYLHLKLFDSTALWIRTTVLKYRLLFSLRYDRFLLKRGIVPKRFYKMVEEISHESSNPK